MAAGADGLSLINTTLGLVIDTDTMRPVLAGTTGGLSGPAIKPIALRCVWQVHEALPDVPLFGIGGIRTGLDALEFVLAGASAVQVGTIVFHDPGAPTRISRELREALGARGIDRLADVIGLGHRPPVVTVPEEADPPGDRACRAGPTAPDAGVRGGRPVTLPPAPVAVALDTGDLALATRWAAGRRAARVDREGRPAAVLRGGPGSRREDPRDEPTSTSSST